MVSDSLNFVSSRIVSFYSKKFFRLFQITNRLRRVFTVLMLVVLLGNPAAAATAETAPVATSFAQDMRYAFYSSGWAKWFGMALTSTASQSSKGWDGKGAPKLRRPAPAKAEKREDREVRVSRVKIYPGDVEIFAGEQIVFTAVGEDADGKAIAGLGVRWSGVHEGKSHKIIVDRGVFSPLVAGKYVITAEVAGHREQVRVSVKGNTLVPRARSKSSNKGIEIDSRELRRKGQVSMVAPVQNSSKQLVSGKGAISKTLRASAKGMSRVSRKLLPPIGEDSTGWNSDTVGSFSNIGNERGDMPGRADSAGAGSGNFQFSAPAVSLDGRGIDLNLLFSYNSRVWHKSGSTMYFDIDRDWIPGWNMGFGKIVMTGSQYMMVDGDGTRHEFTGTAFSSWGNQTFEAHTTDGTFIDYHAWGRSSNDDSYGGKNIFRAGAVLPNGTRIAYGAPANYSIYPTQITDAHGNYITITYRNNEGPNIETITDTLGRMVRYHYDGSGLLTAITEPGLNGGPERQIVRIVYRPLTLSDAGTNYGYGSGFSTVVRQNTIPVVLGIYYPGTNTGYWFGEPDSYSRYGMIRKVSERRGMTFSGGLNEQGSMGPGEQSRVVIYSNPSAPGYSDILGNINDAPTYTQMSEDWWARSTDSVPVTYYNVENNGTTSKITVTRPDGVQSVQISDSNTGSTHYGLMTENIIYPASGGTPLHRSKTFFNPGQYDSSRPERVEVYDEKGQMTWTNFVYGSRYNAPTQISEGSYSGAVLKKTIIEYLNIENYNGKLVGSARDGWGYGSTDWSGSHIFNLPSVVEVFAGDGPLRISRTEYEYDGKQLINTPDVQQHDVYHNPYITPVTECSDVPDPSDPDCNGCTPDPEWPECNGSCSIINECYTSPGYDPLTGYRGNLTKTTTYADAVNLNPDTAIVANFTYDITGNTRIQSTACCEQASFNYTSATGFAWPESMTRGSISDAASQNTTSIVYDFNTGLVMDSYDANGRRSNTVYDAASLRPVAEYSPTGAYVYHEYRDSEMVVLDRVYEAGKNGGDFASATNRYVDGKGQINHALSYASENGNLVKDEVLVEFDNLGRISRQSQPFRSGRDPIIWTSTEYDVLDRPTKTIAPDGTVVHRFYNESVKPPAAISNDGQTVRSRDAWGRERWGRFDEQNRLVEVVEPDPNGNGSVANGGLSTQYKYDTVGNLIEVIQGEQRRYFKYDSLGRLTHQKLAERDATLNDNGDYVGVGMWSDAFKYDNRSNLIWKRDARGVITNFGYENDPLNRLKTVIYSESDAPTAADIADANNVSYAYMTTGDKMRVSNVWVYAGMGNQAISYDSEGRVSEVSQTFGGRETYPLVTKYLWDTLDRIKEVHYPKKYGAGDASKVVVHNYDLASRLTELKYDGATMASNPVFNASNQITSLTVGNQIQEKYDFDPKTGLLLSQQVIKGGEKYLDLKYNYTRDNNADNNGGKTGQLTFITDLKNEARNRAFNYDALGRLVKAKGGQTATSGPNWEQVYSYDRYGNRMDTNLLDNADLWKGTAEGWQRIPSNGPTNFTVYRNPQNSSDGGSYLAFNCGTSPCQSVQSIYQDVNVASLGAQQISYGGKFAVDSGSGASLKLAVHEFDANYGHIAKNEIDVSPTTSYQQISSTFKMSGNTKILRYELYLNTTHTFRADEMFMIVGACQTAQPTWSAQDLPHMIGRADGDGWSANTAQDELGHLQFGPYTNQVAAGAHTAVWNLMIDNNSADNAEIVRLEVSDYTTGGTILASREVTRKEWTSTYQYQPFSLPFVISGTQAGHQLEFRVLWYKQAYIREQNVSLFLSCQSESTLHSAGAPVAFRDGLVELTYNPTNNRITNGNFSYDAAGNQTSAIINGLSTKNTYKYDSANRLAEVKDTSGNTLATYVYGASNQRIMSVEGGITTYYAYEGGALIAEYEAVGANGLQWKMSYVYMGGRLLATEQSSGIRYHHPDRLGSRLVTDALDGSVISENLHLPFGTAMPNGPTLGGDNSWQDPNKTNLSKKKFTSYDRSDATGLDYALNRHYSSSQGRFTQVDPIGMASVDLGDPQRLNLYAYCANDPVNRIDPDGLWSIGSIFKAIGKAIVAIGKKIYSAFKKYKELKNTGRGPTTPTFSGGDIPGGKSGSSGGLYRTPPTFGFLASGSGFHVAIPSSISNLIAYIKDALAKLDSGKNEAIRRLAKKECADLFGGVEKAKSALGKVKYADLGAPTVTSRGAYTSFSHIGASASSATGVISVNVQGSYIRGGKYQATDTVTGAVYPNVTALIRGVDGRYDYSGDDYRAFVLLHEVGHVTNGASGFESDRNDDAAGRRNNDKVYNACFKQ